jgi:hypothetical protein
MRDVTIMIDGQAAAVVTAKRFVGPRWPEVACAEHQEIVPLSRPASDYLLVFLSFTFACSRIYFERQRQDY